MYSSMYVFLYVCMYTPVYIYIYVCMYAGVYVDNHFLSLYGFIPFVS